MNNENFTIKPNFYMLKHLITGTSLNPDAPDAKLVYCGVGIVLIITYIVKTLCEVDMNRFDTPNAIEYLFPAITGLIVIIALALLIGVISGFFSKLNYEAASYNIYNDRIEFEEGFINHKYITLNFRDIKEIHLYENFIQRHFQIGTIKLVTAANSMIDTGVALVDIKNPKAVYNKLKLLIDNKTTNQ